MRLIWIVLAAAVALPASAQWRERLANPKVPVPIAHPPKLDLVVDRIAFARAEDDCASQIAARATQQLTRAGLKVLDRENLEATLAEHRLSLSDNVDANSALQFGKILGATALVYIRTSVCTVEQTRGTRNRTVDKHGEEHLTFWAKTTAVLRGSVQTVDLTTGQVIAAQTLEYSPSEEKTRFDERPEFPQADEIRDRAINSASDLVAHLLGPWTERLPLTFYDDGDCGLKEAWALLKSGDEKAALQRSLENMEACRSNPKAKPTAVSHAWYNVGLGLLLAGQYDGAINHFEEAGRIKATDIVADAIVAAREARDAEAALREYDRRMAELRSGKTSTAAIAEEVRNPAAVSPSSSGASAEERLARLKGLFDKGLLTKEDYERKKAEILKDL